ncbi:unnamed protein product [Closterium sp. Naga37s-1]|nr:unnamed protein product [Closterium sp. Naga37s-1]
MASQAIVAMRICAPPALAPYMGARWRKAPNTPQFSTAFVVPMRPKRVTLSFRRNCRRPISAIFRAQRAGETRPGARSWMERMAKAAEEMARGAERASKEMAKVAAATLENHSKAIEAASPLLSQIVGGNDKATNFIANLIVPHAPGASASGTSAVSAASPRAAAPQQLAEDHLREVSDDVAAHVSIKPANVAPMTSSFTSPSLGDDDSAVAAPAAANADPTAVPLEMRKAGAHVLEGRGERGAMRAELRALEARMDAASAAVEAAKSRRGELLQAHPELRQRVTDVVEGKVTPRACSHPPPPPFPRSPHFPPLSAIPPRSPQLRQRVTDVVEGKVTPRAVTVTPTAVAPSSPSNAPSNAPGNSDAEGEAQEEWEEAEEEQAQAQGGAHGAAQQGVVAGSVQALRAGRHRQRERLQRPGVERRRQHAAQVHLSVLRSLAERHGVLAQSTVTQATTGQVVTAQESEPVQVARDEQPQVLPPVVDTAALSPVELELVKAEESWDKYLEAVAWTKARLHSLRSAAPSPSAAALLSMEAQLVSSLAFAQQRADEEAARVAQLCARVGADAGERRRSREEGLRRAAEAGAKMGKGAEGGPGNGGRGEREGDEGKRVVSGGSSGGSLAGIGDMMSKLANIQQTLESMAASPPSLALKAALPSLSPVSASSASAPSRSPFSSSSASSPSLSPSSSPSPTVASLSSSSHTLSAFLASLKSPRSSRSSRTTTPAPAFAAATGTAVAAPPVRSTVTVAAEAAVGTAAAVAATAPSAYSTKFVGRRAAGGGRHRSAEERENYLKVYARALFPSYVDTSASPAQQQHGVDGLVRELVLHGASEDWARGYIAEALLRPILAAPKPLAVAMASGPPSPRASSSHHECSQHELQQYAQAICSAYVDASMSASEREVGTTLFVEVRLFLKASLETVNHCQPANELSADTFMTASEREAGTDFFVEQWARCYEAPFLITSLTISHPSVCLSVSFSSQELVVMGGKEELVATGGKGVEQWVRCYEALTRTISLTHHVHLFSCAPALDPQIFLIPSQELVAMGGKEVEQWARSFVAQSLATEVRKRKVVRA